MTKRKKTLIELLLDAGFAPKEWDDNYPFAAQDGSSQIDFYESKPVFSYLMDRFNSQDGNPCLFRQRIKYIDCLCKNYKRTVITKQRFIDAYNKKHGIMENKTEWPEESRIDSIGQNGATGEHYPQDNGMFDDALSDKHDLSVTDGFEKQSRYQDKSGEDWINECARTMTPEEFRGAMKFTIGKYVRRLGKKDSVISEVTKIADYAMRWKSYEERLK